jgi:hypothetical protein
MQLVVTAFLKKTSFSEEPDPLYQWFPTCGRFPNQGGGVSDVGSREGFMENSIIMKKKLKFVSKFNKNDHENVIIESVC